MAPGATDVYKHVHEYGMYIYARMKPVMVFRVEDGTIVRAKRVHIREKDYFWGGLAQASSRLNEIFNEALSRVRFTWTG